MLRFAKVDLRLAFAAEKIQPPNAQISCEGTVANLTAEAF
jgi:hypothetical protein